jgi:hypothetical protein
MGEPHFFKKNDVKRYWAGTWMGGGVTRPWKYILGRTMARHVPVNSFTGTLLQKKTICEK